MAGGAGVSSIVEQAHDHLRGQGGAPPGKENGMYEEAVVFDREDWLVARDIVRTARAFPDDLPDGMSDWIDEVWQEYRESGKGDDDKVNLVNGVREVCAEFGFPFS